MSEPPAASEASTGSQSGFQVIAHRGGAGHAPENTLPAFRWSLANGFTHVELDVRLSLEEVLVLFHDHTLERKAGQEGSVGVFSAEELKDFEIGTWFDREHPEVAESFAGTRITTLSDVFDEFGAQLYYHVEIKEKNPRVPRLLYEVIRAAGLTDRVTVTSFESLQVARIQAIDAKIPVCWLLERNEDLRRKPNARAELLDRQRKNVDFAKRFRFAQVAVPAGEISKEIVDYAHANRIGIRAWGVKNAQHEIHVINSGSDGATTDWPDRLRARLRN